MARRPPTFDMDALITQYQHDTSRPRADEALHTLRKIGSVVKPIMRQRSWRVGTLAEFYPREDNLLGMNTNRGQMIQLRLRHPGDHTQFLPFEAVVDTMLHELCHNVIGPHNQQFHALWEQLREEHEALVRKGYTGEGFLGQGQMLGGRRMPRQEASRLARQAAEQRRVRNQGSGQRLGGTGILRGQDARAVIADAVERRLKIERGCANGTEAGAKVARDEAGKGSMTTTQAGPADENEETMMQAYIDLIQEEEREKFGGYYEPPSAANPAGPRGAQGRDQTLLDQQKEIEMGILRERQNQQQQQQQATSNPTSTSRPPTKPALPLKPPQPHSKPKSTPANPLAASSTNNPNPQPSTKPPTRKPVPTTNPALPPPPPAAPSTTWTCEICTLINPLTYLSCDACGVERPAAISYNDYTPSPSASPSPATTSNGRPTHPALAPRTSAHDSISRFTAERERKVASAPLGWRCVGCGNFMESEWWTCARCGRMKERS